jgi:putative Holliday junction resolvase
MRRFLAAAREHAVKGVIVGLPLEADGSEGDAARSARALAEDIGARSGLPVEFVDERMTTARVLGAVREMGGGTRGRKGDVDALAATLLLQLYLDARRGTGV